MIPSLQGVLGRLTSVVRGSHAAGSATFSSPASRTGPQVTGASGMGVLGGLASLVPQLPAGYETYRRMRRDPTIALARALAVAPVVAGKWTVEADADVPEGIRGWIDKQFLTVRELLLESILKHAYVDFGHQGFELVWGVDADGRQCIVRFKPLLPDITEILIDDHGGLAGLRQRKVDLLGASAMLVSFGGEGSNLYGEPLLENVREVWNDWRKANEVAARYDRKIAGAYLLLHYPSFGQGIDQNGAKLDNVYLAQRILDKLEAASGVAVGDVPSELAPGQDPNQTAWRLEVQGSAGGQQQGFVDRLRYLDSLKVRGILLPERAILEGQHGTRAESQSQGDLAFLQAELVHHHVTREINRQAVDPVLEANWGPAYRGKVRLAAAPLSSDNLGFLRQLVTQVLSDPKDFADLFHRADWPAIFDAVGLPQSKVTGTGPSGPSAILSAIRRLQHEAMEKTKRPTQPPTRQEGHSRTGTPTEDIAFQPQDAHIERDVTDALHLANFNPHEPRDDQGRWTKAGSEAAPSAATGLMDVADPIKAPGNEHPSAAPPAGQPKRPRSPIPLPERTYTTANDPDPAAELNTDAQTITIFVGHTYSVRPMIKQFEHKLNERKRDDPNWDAGPRWVAAIACEADQPGVKREIEREGLAPPDSAFQFSEKKVPMVEGVQALFKAIPDLLKAAKTQWPGQPVKIQIVADPSAAWAIRNYDYKNHPVTPLPDALQAGSPKDLVAKSGDEVPIPLKDRRGYPHKLPWYITTIKTYSNMKTYDGSLNKPSQKQ